VIAPRNLKLPCKTYRAPIVLALAIATNANAADLPFKAPPAQAGYDWTGFYVGGHIGFATGNSGWTFDPIGGGAPVSGSFGLYQSPNAFRESGSWFEGVHAGYNYMLRNRVVLGVVSDLPRPNFRHDHRRDIEFCVDDGSPKSYALRVAKHKFICVRRAVGADVDGLRPSFDPRMISRA